MNDNEPRFIYPKTIERFAKQAYFGAIARDEKVSSSVIQIKVNILELNSRVFEFNTTEMQKLAKFIYALISLQLGCGLG